MAEVRGCWIRWAGVSEALKHPSVLRRRKFFPSFAELQDREGLTPAGTGKRHPSHPQTKAI